MSSREDTKEDSSREESYELVTKTVTPHDKESRRTRADTGESDKGTPSVEDLQEKAQRIRQRFDQRITRRIKPTSSQKGATIPEWKPRPSGVRQI